MSTKTSLDQKMNVNFLTNSNNDSNKDITKSWGIFTSPFRFLINLNTKIFNFSFENSITTSNSVSNEDEQLKYYREAMTYSMNFEGKHIAMYEFGTRKKNNKVLLIQELNTNTYQNQSTIDRLVSAGYFVITFDLPGHGFSEGKKPKLSEIKSLTEKINTRYDNKFIKKENLN